MINKRDGASPAEDDAPSCPESEASQSYVTIRNGDALDELRKIPDASIDAIVTDPPYELGFMGKKWDGSGIAYSVELWREALRVLRPGGHLVAFGGTRTYHRMACAVEDAGFEIRDSLTWLYGSGFPKSLDVGKAIDKARDDRPDILHVTAFVRAARDRAGMRNADVDAALGVSAMCDHWCRAAPLQATVPTWEQWERLRELLKFGDEMDAEVWRLNGRKGTPGEAWGQREVIGLSSDRRGDGTVVGLGHSGELRSSEAATDAARQWQGWGTALKPAVEPIVLARKPLNGTVAANVLAHGTSALNIDGTRVGSADKLVRPSILRTDNEVLGKGLGAGVQDEPAGRWPANVLLTHAPDCGDVCTPGCPVAELDAQSGTLKTGGGRRNSPKDAGTYGAFAGDEAPRSFEANEGGASRFFPVFRYQAKAPAKERPKVDGVAHPTVKPLELMRWLVRLVTPPGGVVLDPFAGSGTTLQAAREEGFASIGIEREPTYLPLIAHRLGVEVAEIIDPLLATIGAAPDRDTLLALWRAHKGTWTPAYDEAVRDRLSEIESAA